jgi:starch-binding outer membrane protein, SusD/RagB family
MKKIQINLNKISRKYCLYFLSACMLLLLFSSCKKQLDVKDPNDPTFDVNVTSESGLAAYAKGGIYWNGFGGNGIVNYGDNWLGDSYFSLPWGYHELMGDCIGGGQGSNNQTTTMGVPDKFVADLANPGSTTFTNSSPQATGIIRSFNNSGATSAGNNALYYEWTNMYAMINVCNIIFEKMGGASLSGDKAATMRAWAYWWKGYAYAQLGTLYYAGLVVDKSNLQPNVVSNYVKQSDIIAESNKQLNLALTALNGISNQADYGAMIAQLIPSQCQIGIGNPLTSAQWKRTINTMLARNILLNHLAPYVNGNPAATITKSTITPMAAADWNSVITLCTNGIQQGDNVFTGRTTGSNSFFSVVGGSVAGLLTASNQTTTYKLGERLVQQFKAGDLRRANFSTGSGTFYGDANTNSTRYSLVDGVTAGFTTIPILGSRQVGGLEIYIGPTFEENLLMLAEANIRLGVQANINTGVGLINAIRTYQGSGVAALPNGMTQVAALQELTMERLAALALRGLSFYDIRRWGWTYSIANGGGRWNCTLIFNNTVYNNARIDYNFMDYWDVPGDEIERNAPASGSAPVVNVNW